MKYKIIKEKIPIILIISIMDQIIMMMTGGRQDPVAYILTLVFICARLFIKVRLRATIIWLE